MECVTQNVARGSFEMIQIAGFSDRLQHELGELLIFSDSFTTTQWGLVSLCVVVFGFMCLRGSGINR